MEFSFEDQKNSSSDSGLASERLRKAIERNRAKQAKRTSKVGAGATSSSGSPQSATGKRRWTPPGTSPRSRTASSVRTGVARPDEETEFSTDIKRRRRSTTRQATRASYLPATTKTRRKRSRTQKRSDKDFTRYLVIGAWIFCTFLLLRLVFSSGGVVDYYSGKSLLNSRIAERERIITENKELREEIRLIEQSSAYQRQLIRDHLGYIASDEYLIIFPNSSSGPSI